MPKISIFSSSPPYRVRPTIILPVKLFGDTAPFTVSRLPRKERIGDDEDDLNTNQIQFRLGLSYLPLRWMTWRLGYEFNKYSSSEGDFDDYTENRALLTITLAPDQP